jgi:hypothetical protein
VADRATKPLRRNDKRALDANRETARRYSAVKMRAAPCEAALAALITRLAAGAPAKHESLWCRAWRLQRRRPTVEPAGAADNARAPAAKAGEGVRNGGARRF